MNDWAAWARIGLMLLQPLVLVGAFQWGRWCQRREDRSRTK